MLYLAEILQAQSGLTVLVGHIRILGGDLAEALLCLHDFPPQGRGTVPRAFPGRLLMIAGQPGARMPGDVSLRHLDPARHVTGGREPTGFCAYLCQGPASLSELSQGIQVCCPDPERAWRGRRGRKRGNTFSPRPFSRHHRGQN